MAPQVPTAICKVMPAWQSADGLAKYIYRKSIYAFGRFHNGAPSWDAELDAAVLTWDHPSTSRACEVRHIAVSFPGSVGEEEAVRRLPKIIADWIAKYAPDRDWIAAIHKDNGKYHVHLAVTNVKDGKPMRLLPHMVVEMSRMGFTSEARDAKGVGSTGLKFYSKTSKPLVADMIRVASKEELNEWIQAGQLRRGRVDKNGVLTSVEWDHGNGKKPRRIRLETLQRLTARRAAEAGDDAAVPHGAAIADTLRSMLPAVAAPTTHKLDAAHIASLNHEQIIELIHAGRLGIGRRDRQGRIVSVVADGRRVRLATVQRFAASAAPGQVLDPDRRVEPASTRPTTRRHPVGRRRATARGRRRTLVAGGTGAVPAPAARTTPAPSGRAAPGLRPALPAVEPASAPQPGMAEVARTQSMDRPDRR
jgi:hypothetical protein